MMVEVQVQAYAGELYYVSAPRDRPLVQMSPFEAPGSAEIQSIVNLAILAVRHG